MSLLPDPADIAGQLADRRLEQIGIAKAAGAAVRADLVKAYLPVCKAVVAGLGDTGAGVTGLAAAIERNGEAITRLYEADQARRAEIAARVQRPQFRNATADDVERIRQQWQVMAAAEGEAPAGLRIPKVNGSA